MLNNFGGYLPLLPPCSASPDLRIHIIDGFVGEDDIIIFTNKSIYKKYKINAAQCLECESQ